VYTSTLASLSSSSTSKSSTSAAVYIQQNSEDASGFHSINISFSSDFHFISFLPRDAAMLARSWES